MPLLCDVSVALLTRMNSLRDAPPCRCSTRKLRKDASSLQQCMFHPFSLIYLASDAEMARLRLIGGAEGYAPNGYLILSAEAGVASMAAAKKWGGPSC